MGSARTESMQSGLLSTLGLVVAACLLVAGLTWLLQSKLLFRPFSTLVAVPSDWGLAYEDVWLGTDDGVRLHGWFLPAAEPSRRGRNAAPHTLLFLHGNAGNVSHRGPSLAIFAKLGLDVLIIDYRGYGQSHGRPSEHGLNRDAAAAWHWLTAVRNIAPEQIVIFGRSLGGAVATTLAARERPGALIVESSFTDIAAMARLHHPLLARLVPLRYRFASLDALARVDCPVLILHSRDDGVVPFAHGRALFDAATAPKRFIELTGGHNEGFLASQPRYQQGIAEFLDWRPLPPEHRGP
jgi:fermentation-respiration switch protein FrsA (DUF1100 family)